MLLHSSFLVHERSKLYHDVVGTQKETFGYLSLFLTCYCDNFFLRVGSHILLDDAISTLIGLLPRLEGSGLHCCGGSSCLLSMPHQWHWGEEAWGAAPGQTSSCAWLQGEIFGCESSVH